MLEKPQIEESLIIDCLENQYGLEKVVLEFLPIGNDINTGVYHVSTSDQRELYLKLRKNDFNKISVIVPHMLEESGIKQVIAPLLTKDQQEWTTLNEYFLALYPYIQGKNGFQKPLSNSQWVELGSVVKGLHSLQIPKNLQRSIPYEVYSPKYRDEAKRIIKQVQEESFVDEVAKELADFMKLNDEKIQKIVKRSEKLGVELNSQRFELVLCHADLHGANVLIDTDDNIYLIDWDTLIFAPKERDLMFIGGGVGGSWNKEEEMVLFYQGYGETEINHTAITYYRYERIVQDIVEFAKRLLFANDGGKDRENSLEKFKNAFLPGNVVEIALKEEIFNRINIISY